MFCSARGLYKHVKILERAFCPLQSPIRCKSDINKSAVRQDQPLEDLEKPSIGWKIIERAVSSLRIDTVTSAGLSVSRSKVWESCLEGHLLINNKVVKKKSEKIREGDVIDLDVVLSATKKKNKVQVEEDGECSNGVHGWLRPRTRRSRVEVVSIGAPTRKGGHHVKLKRIKEFCYVIDHVK